MVRDTPPSQDASTHQIWNSYLKECRRYAPDTKRDGRTDIVITIKTKSEVKVKVTVIRKWYATLGHTKMHPHTKFGIPTSKNIGDMHRTKRDGRTDSAITICLPKFLWGHKNDPRILLTNIFSRFHQLVDRMGNCGKLIQNQIILPDTDFGLLAEMT